MEQSPQLVLDFTQKIDDEGALKTHIEALYVALDYNEYHRKGSIRKWLGVGSLSECRDVTKLLWYDSYLSRKIREGK